MVKNILDIPRIYTALAEWGACTLYISLMRRRVHGKTWLFYSFAALIVQTVFLVSTVSLPLFLWIPCMITAILFMFGYITACCDVSIYDSAYSSIRAFVLAETAASLEWQIYCFFWPENNGGLLIRILLLSVVYCIGGIAVWLLERPQMPDNWHLGINRKELLSAFLIGVVIFTVSNMSFLSGNTPFSGQFPKDILNIRTLVDMGGFAILFAHHIQCCQARAWREVEAMRSVLQNQYVQYRQSRESISLINRKYHDIKHQIAALRTEQDPKRRSEWLDEMEDDIKSYEAQNKTGNGVLDTVLTGKSMYCQKHEIVLTCVADGTLLNFMDVMDICSIFGNALDNAIECEKRIADKEKRLIHVTVSLQKSFVLLKFENYYEGKLEFEDGLPLTTKPDTDFHGYGLKSIKSTAQKYGGVVTVNIEQKWFVLKVLIPAQNDNKEIQKF
jgi:hypothetical protein